jgi:hypothetical protein
MPTFILLQRGTHRLVMPAVLTIMLAMPGVVKADEHKETGALGKWKLTRALDSADITSLDDREAKRLIGRTFIIDEDHVRFGKRDCGAPELSAKIVEPTWFLREQVRATNIDLALPNPVTVVNLACTFAFVKDEHHMIMFWKGWFFDAKRVR